MVSIRLEKGLLGQVDEKVGEVGNKRLIFNSLL